MRCRDRRLVPFVALLVAIAATAGPALAGEAWPQWGGPDRDFTVPARSLSTDWGEDGPKELWSRPLGGGFASIVSDGDRLYAAYRVEDEEIVEALDPKTGKTIWKHAYSAPVEASQSLSLQYGEGPNSTPLLVDGKIVSFGFTGKIVCLDTKDGKERWSHDMVEAFEVNVPYFGHASSPIEVGKNVVIVAGGLHAFDLSSGKLAWKNTDFDDNYGSPILVERNGKSQIVTPVAAHLAGFDAKTGETLWSIEHKNQWGTILTTPVADDDGRVLISAGGVGAILVEPGAKGSDAQPLWRSETTHVGHSNMLRVGDWAFASSGDSTTFVTAVSLADGTQAWKERGFGRANLLRVGNQVVLLDFEAELAIVSFDKDGMAVKAQASIGDKPTWTPPTLLGTTLYVRDEERIRAYDLSGGN